jgi:hypothetical protein
MANTAILCRRYVIRIFDQLGARSARRRQESSDVAAFAAGGNGKVNITPKECRRRKITWIGRTGVVAHNAFIQGRNMIGFLAYGPDRNIVGIATVAGFAVAVDIAIAMGKVGCFLERQIDIRIVVALEAVVIR